MSASLRLEVFVARIASGFAIASSLREERALRLEVLEDRLDDDVGVPRAFAGDVGNQPVERVAHAPLVAQAPLEELGRALDRGREALGRRVLQRDREAAHRADRRDVAAHHAGADDVHVARLEGGTLAERLQPLLQEEDADQVRAWSDARTAPRPRRTGRCDAANGLPSYLRHSSRIAYGAG